MEENQEQSSLSTQTPPEMPQNAFKNSILLQKVLILGMVILIGAASIVGGFVMYKNSFGKQVTPSPTPPITPSPTTNPTENWKTYTNETRSYTFKYPQTYTLKNDSQSSLDQDVISLEKDVELGPGAYGSTNAIKGVVISFIFWESKNPVTKESLIDEYGSQIEILQTSIDNHTATEVKGEFIFDRNIYVVYPKGSLHISTGIADNSTNETRNNYLKDFSQILSTFKFTYLSLSPTCIPRPKCLDTEPRCMIPETENMCPPTINKSPTPEQVACTMDALQCPDGSWVGRTGQNCEFKCP